jgi:hypothetical protein
MSSLRRTISSRANGARSLGPITPDGKDRASRNATRHGLLAKCLVLENESRAGFDTLLAEFIARFGPTDGVELGMVEEMLAAFWRQRRAWAIEARNMDNQLSTQPPEQDELNRLTGAFNAVAAKPNPELMHRYQTHLHRMYQRALGNLILMRSLPELRPPAENTKLPNEPSPRSPVRAPNVREGLCEGTQPPEPAVEPTPPPENSELPNDPSPISGQLSAPGAGRSRI